MRTWEDYKRHVKAVDPASKHDMEEIEALTAIVSSIIKKRTELGISQRALAAECNIPQSSVARIESFKTTPKLNTLLKLMRPLGLKLQAVSIT
jgi:predicted transcriptional regulator